MAKARYQHRHGSKANLSASDVLPNEIVIVDTGDSPSGSGVYYKTLGATNLVKLANDNDVDDKIDEAISDQYDGVMLLMSQVSADISNWKKGQIGWLNGDPVAKTGAGQSTTVNTFITSENLVINIRNGSGNSDDYPPSALAVYTYVQSILGDIETALAQI